MTHRSVLRTFPAVVRSRWIRFLLLAGMGFLLWLWPVPAAASMTSQLGQVDILLMPPTDNEALLTKDFETWQPDVPPSFALPIPVNVTPATRGTWDTLEDGSRVWRLRIQSPGALSLNLGFTHYNMPPGGQLRLSTADGGYTVRPFTAEDNEEHGQLWTPLLPGDDILIEVNLPADVAGDLDLTLGSVNHGYREFGKVEKSGSCNLDVVCSAADGYSQVDAWRQQIRSVAVISLGGGTFCTGFMVNNTAQDLKPYFMTANHCSINSGNAASLVTYWNYENSTCRAPGSGASGSVGNGSLSQFMTGAFFRSASGASDFTLVELDDPVPIAFGVHWAGWNAISVDPTSAVAIHHPSTDEKRISFENDPTSTTSYLGTNVPGAGTHIRITDWDLGTTEPGSSGSPLFDSNGRIVGQLHGGNAACGNNLSDWYGRFSVSWTGGGTSATRLSDWLDPVGSGTNLVIDGISQFSEISVDKSVAPTDVAPGQTITYTLSFTNSGSLTTSGVVISDSMPVSVTVTGVTSHTEGSGVTIIQTSGSPNFAWTVDELAAGTGSVITVTGVVSAGLNADVVLTNTATITGASDVIPGNNRADAALSVTVPRVAFSAGAYGVGEGVGLATITVTLDAINPHAPVAVVLQSSDGSAIATDDYSAINQTLTVPAGAQQATFTVSIVDDAVDELNETFSLDLSAPVGAALGATTTTTITITDDDVAAIGVSKLASVATANVGDSVVYTFHITNSGTVILNNVSAVDDKLGTVALDATSLATGTVATGVVTYTVQASDLPGPLVNTVTATALSAGGNPVQAQAGAVVNLGEEPARKNWMFLPRVNR
jgi:uncharacterized repeat protein (TIGR01451 family)